MLSDEEKEVIENLTEYAYATYEYILKSKDAKIILNLIEKQSKEIEELKETLKCTQNSWFEDTQKIEEMKKQIDLDNECEIALNNKIMDLEKEIEELKDKCKELIFEKQELTSALLDSTPNDKIKAKIEPVLKQLERKMEEEYNKYGNSREYQDVVDAYNFLQSLLEKE